MFVVWLLNVPSNMLVYLRDRFCTDNFTSCHTEIEVADPTFYLTQSQYTDPGSTSPIADPMTPGAWQGSHWNANFLVSDMTRPGKIPSQAGFEPRIFSSRGRRLNDWANEAIKGKGMKSTKERTHKHSVCLPNS